MPKGGARPGAGRKPKKMEAKTLERMAVIAAFNQRAMKAADKLFNAQLQLSLGSMLVYRVDETEDGKGKTKRIHTHVTNPHEITTLLDEHDGGPGEVDGSYYFFTDVPPDNRALDSLLNRSLGKPKEQVEVLTDPRLTEIKRAVERRAEVTGRSYDAELQIYFSVTPQVPPDVREQLVSQSIN